jgi:hypothetical protein
MLSLVDAESSNAIENEKQILLNRIIAAGINSLSGAATSSNSQNPDRQLLDSFVSQSLDKVLAVWPNLDDRIKFYIFKANISEFEEYMKQKIRGSND